MRARVLEARLRQQARFAGHPGVFANAQMDVAMLRPAGKDERGGPNNNGGWVLDDRWATDYSLPALDARHSRAALAAPLVGDISCP